MEPLITISDKNLKQAIIQPKNKVVIERCDHRAQLDQAESNRLNAVARLEGNCVSELNVFTGDARVFAAGPEPFFDWVNLRDDCAMEMFMDATSTYFQDIILIEGEEAEDEEEVLTWYFYKGVLYVLTSEGSIACWDEWEKFINQSLEE